MAEVNQEDSMSRSSQQTAARGGKRKKAVKRDNETPSVTPSQFGNITVSTEMFDASSVNLLFDEIEDALDDIIEAGPVPSPTPTLNGLYVENPATGLMHKVIATTGQNGTVVLAVDQDGIVDSGSES